MTPNKLGANWRPLGETAYAWIAMDKNGKLAFMSNNGFGEMPLCLISLEGADEMLQDFDNFLHEDSELERNLELNGSAILHFYSSWFFRDKKNHSEVYDALLEDLTCRKNYSEVNLSKNKGMFVFQALDRENTQKEFPVGYVGQVNSGDYYKYLAPSIFSSVENIPKRLRKLIAVSDSLDFTKLDLLKNESVRSHFDRLYLSAD